MIRAIHNAATMTMLVTGETFIDASETIPNDLLAQLFIDIAVNRGIVSVPLGAYAMLTVNNVDSEMMGYPPYMIIVYSATGYPMTAAKQMREDLQKRVDTNWGKALRFGCDIEWTEVPVDHNVDVDDSGNPAEQVLTATAEMAKLHFNATPT